jgi:CRISPR-associated exonuclease Cas4
MEKIFTALCDPNEIIVTAEEIRQFFYCQRIPIFRHIRKIKPQQTYLMQSGTDFHDKVVYGKKTNKESKEILAIIAPHAPNTEQYHDIYLESKRLHLGARLDLFEKHENDIYPVEIKTGIKPSSGRAVHHYIQLTAQSVLLEEKFNCLVHKARIYYTGSQESEIIDISLAMKLKLFQAISKIRKMFLEEILPNPTGDEGKCSACEFLPYCGKV